MNRTTFNVMLAQYSVREMAGEGAVTWENGVRCVIPRVEIKGKTMQTAIPTPENPVEPAVNSGMKILSQGKNLFDVSQLEYGVIINGGGVGESIFPVSRISGCAIWKIPVEPSTSYTISYDNKDVWLYRLCEMNNHDLCTDNRAWYAWGDPGAPVTIKTGPTSTYIAISFVLRDTTATMTAEIMESINVQVESGAVATSYTPYFDGGTAVAPELFAIPGTTYMDTWDAQTGKGIRRCAVIESYNGEMIETAYISSTGELSVGAYVVYGIADTLFKTQPQPLIQPPGAGRIIQTAGVLDNCPITVKYVTHS